MKRLLTLIAALLLLSSFKIQAQAPGPQLQQGMTPYGTFQDGEFESVNLGNGNVVVHIPLAAYPQRGGKLRLAFNFYATQKNWYVYNTGYSFVWRYSVVPSLTRPSAWVGPDQGMQGTTSTSTWTDDFGKKWTIKSYHAITADGASHELLASDTLIGRAPAYSSDGTGIVSDTALWDRDGIEYTASTTANGPGNVIDTNGNEITYSTSGWTDTLGRVIPGYPTTGTMTTAPGVSSSTTNCPSGTVSALQWNAPATSGATVPYKFCYSNFNYSTNFALPNVAEAAGTQLLISAIVLPNLTKWVFAYDSYLDISSITLPEGGVISYQWTSTNTNDRSRIITSRTVNANDGTGAHTWTYQWPYGSTVQVIVTDPLSNDTVVNSSSGYVTQTQTYSGSHSSGMLLKTVTTDYIGYPDPMGNYNVGTGAPVNQLSDYQTVAWASGQAMTMKTTSTYDSGFQYAVYDIDQNKTYQTASYGLPVNQTTSDYGPGAPGGTLKQTNTVYYWQTYSNYLTANILSLPQTVKVEDANGNPCAQTDFTYDNASYLTASGIGTQHITPPGGVRGNVSTVTQQLATLGASCPASPSWTPITSYKNMYDTGTVYKSIDPLSHTTTYAYSATFAGAYPTTITNALNQSTTLNYDLNTGLLTSTTDPNLLQTSYTYDNMFRLASVTRPDGGSDTITHQESTFPFTATVTSKINSSQSKVTTNVFDGLGRVSQSQLTSDPQGTVYTDTTYDAAGHVYSVSNPHRSGSDPTTSSGITTYGYDGLGRKITETYPDSSARTTAYCGSSTLVTDPVGKWRRSRTDGLGRLVEVDEPNAIGAIVASTGCPGTGEPIWVTSYSFDTLSDLIQVVQSGSHQRTFTYDSFSRMLTSNNPEVGTITYTYNADDTLHTKQDARSITTTYGYDAIRRELSRTYSNGDPTVSTTYDQSSCLGLSACQNIGHRTSATDAAGSESWAYQADTTNSRDVHKEQRITSGITKTTTYYLDLAGNLTQVIYPTGRTVNYSYNSADRAITAADGSNGITYATGFQTPSSGCPSNAVCYTPQGGVYAMSIGQSGSFTGLNVSENFNSRLQPQEIKGSSTSGNAMDITYSFVDPTTGKNAGHVYSITSNLNSSRTQSFTYDQVNRILSAGTTATTGSLCWGYQYTYDTWGNLTSQAGWTPSYNACSEAVMNTVIADGNNHISAFGYDASGNATSDDLYSYTWDGESQLKSAAGVTYTYDGDGRRVSKVGSKLYWYGAGGEILAETDASGNTLNEYIYFGGKRIALLPASSTAQYYVEDTLGSSRVVTTSTGVVCYDADFDPYGGERAVTNSCTQNIYKFEGKERDTETGNDDFGARYYTHRFGRWLSADWSSVPVPVPYANLTNPQTLNLYSMVADDPESFADLDGHNVNDPGRPGGPAATSNCTNSPATNNCGQTQQNTEPEAQNPNEWSLSWQINASANFFVSELKGVADTTVTPIVQTVEHPVEAVEGVVHAVAHPVETVENVAKAAVDTTKAVASGDPRAIGQVAGLVISTYVAARGAQGAEIKVSDDLRIAPTGNRTGPTGPIEGKVPHYHRRVVGPNGETVPGQGIGRHRPWETKSVDKSFWDRF